jgi:hypothetical protein
MHCFASYRVLLAVLLHNTTFATSLLPADKIKSIVHKSMDFAKKIHAAKHHKLEYSHGRRLLTGKVSIDVHKGG